MNIYKTAKELFKRRNICVRQCVEEQSDFYFSRLDAVEDKFVKNFYSQAVCGTVADTYDFFTYLQSNNNIFYRNAKLLTPELGREIYKWNAMYHTIQFLRIGFKASNEKLKADLEACLFNAYELSDKEQEVYLSFLDLIRENPARFEVEFSKEFLKNIFGGENSGGPVTLAFANNFFYNSFHEFAQYVTV